MLLDVSRSSVAFSQGSSTTLGSVADVLCIVFGSVSMLLLVSLSFSVLTKFESIFMRWHLLLRITLSLPFNNLQNRGILFLLRIPVHTVVILAVTERVVSIQWLKFSGLVDFLSFVLVFTFKFSEGASVCNPLFISNSE